MKKRFVLIILFLLLLFPIVSAEEFGVNFLDRLRTFLSLEDTPSTYSGSADKCVTVNSAGNGLEFITCPGGGGGGNFTPQDFQSAFDDNISNIDVGNFSFTDFQAAFNLNISDIDIGNFSFEDFQAAFNDNISNIDVGNFSFTDFQAAFNSNQTNIFNQSLNTSDSPSFQNITVEGNVTSGFFNGLFNWTVNIPSRIYLLFNGNELTFNESQLNTTIEDIGDGKYLNLSGTNANQPINIAPFNLTARNIQINNQLTFETGEHSIEVLDSNTVNPTFKIDSVTSKTFWFQSSNLTTSSDVTFLFSVTNRTLLYAQGGANESAGGLGNSWMIIPNDFVVENFRNDDDTINISKITNCFNVINAFNFTSRIDCDSQGTGSDLFVQDDIQLGGRLFAGNGIRSDGSVSFFLNGFDFDVFNGSSHFRTPRRELVGFEIGENATIFFENFDDGSIAPFINTTSDPVTTREWIVVADANCFNDLCARSQGGALSPIRGMEANISTVGFKDLVLNFSVTTVGISGTDLLNVTLNNNSGSGDFQIYVNITPAAGATVSIPLTSNYENISSITLGYNFNANVVTREGYVNDVSIVGEATESTTVNLTRLDTDIKLGDGTQRIFWNDTTKVLELPGNTSLVNVQEENVTITDSLTLNGTTIKDFGQINANRTNFFDQDLNTTDDVTFINVNTPGIFTGLFSWIINTLDPSTAYLSFNGSTLSFDESKLNTTIDDRTIANETNRLQNITTYDCPSGEFATGFQDNGTVICGIPAGGGGVDLMINETDGSEDYLNISNFNLSFSEEQLNSTIDNKITAAQGGACSSSNSVISGGNVVWSLDDLIFHVSPTVYCIAGLQYQTNVTIDVTLDAANSSFDRFDIIVVNVTQTAGFVKGVAAEDPLVPTPNGFIEIKLSEVLIQAGATEPGNDTGGGISVELIYDEQNGADWPGVDNTGGSINFTASSNPSNGTVHIETETPISKNEEFRLNDPATFDPSSFTSPLLTIEIKVEVAWDNKDKLNVMFLDTGGNQLGTAIDITNGAFGFDASNTAGYQILIIPLSDFGVLGSSVKSLSFTAQPFKQNTIDFLMDFIRITGTSGGGEPPVSGLAHSELDDLQTTSGQRANNDHDPRYLAKIVTSLQNIEGRLILNNSAFTPLTIEDGFGGITLNVSSDLIVDNANGRVGIGTSTPTTFLTITDTSPFNLTSNAAGVDTILLDPQASGAGNVLASIGFGKNGSTGATRRAVIASVFTGADADEIGLAFFTHPSATGSADLVEALRIDDEGQVGIGTTTPNHPFVVSQNAEAFTASFNRDGAGPSRIIVNNTEGQASFGADGANGQLFDTADGEILRWSTTNTFFNELGVDRDFRIESDDNENMFFLDGGNDRIGIGTATPAVTLDVFGNVTIGTPGTDIGKLSVEQDSSGTSNALLFLENGNITTDTAIIFPRGSSYTGVALNITTAAASSSAFYMIRSIIDADGTPLEAFNVRGDGNIGIGTASPNQKLHLNNDATGSVRIRLENDEGFWDVKSDNNDFQLQNGSGVTAFHIEGSNTRVGIGTAGPRTLFSLFGTAPTITFEDDDTTVEADQILGAIDFRSSDIAASPPTDDIVAKIEARSQGVISSANWESNLVFYTSDTSTLTEALRIDKLGNVGIGFSAPTERLQISSGAVIIDGKGVNLNQSGSAVLTISAETNTNSPSVMIGGVASEGFSAGGVLGINRNSAGSWEALIHYLNANILIWRVGMDSDGTNDYVIQDAAENDALVIVDKGTQFEVQVGGNLTTAGSLITLGDGKMNITFTDGTGGSMTI